MSTISGISNSMSSQLFETQNTNSGSTEKISGRQPPPPPPSGRGIMSAVQDALGQMGLSMNSSSATSEPDSSSSTNSTIRDGSTDTAATSTAQKALYKFMHDLFTAMQDQSSTTISSTVYSSPMTTSIQDVIQALRNSSGTTSSNTLSNGTASAQTTDLSNLQSDFQSLVTAIGGDSATGSSATSLQTFLQNFESNLNQQRSSSINFINTIA